ncbi:MAG: hypothetical protein FWF52_03340 [Candidatus Azobacteroides sp.]|nr:hypothetical protein [Candidatus Azobacteroides sp.]
MFYIYPENRTWVYCSIIFFLVLFLLYKYGWGYYLKKQIGLPIVDDSGTVYGKVTTSAKRKSKSKYFHPVIRIMVEDQGKLLLQEQPLSLDGEVRALDFPFERYLLFEETVEEGVKKALIEKGMSPHLPCRFMLRHAYRTEKTNRLIYLYLCNRLNKNHLDDLRNLEEGKWWTSTQINEKLGTGIFSSCFEDEFEVFNAFAWLLDKLPNLP